MRFWKMNEEEIINLANQYFNFEDGWIAETEYLFKFARAVYEEGQISGFDGAWDEGRYYD